MDTTESYMSITNQLLIAMPTLKDPNFFQAVVYLCEYNEEGAMGIIINKPLEVSLGEILRHLDIPITDQQVNNYPVLRGGPIAQDQGFIIQRQQDLLPENDKILISASKADLIKLAEGKDLPHSLVSLGYAGWSAGQLEQELKDNAWLLVPANPVIVFDTPFELRWRMAAALIGVDFGRMSGDVGHA